MLRQLLRPIYRHLPTKMRRSLRALRLERIVRKDEFNSDEPEFKRLAEWLAPGDTALDIGANFGSYTLRMSQLVGNSGRVFAFEPVPQTFAMLVRSLTARGCMNVSALNLACSNHSGFVRMSIPDDPLTGEDLYQASITEDDPEAIIVYRLRIDDLPLPIDRLRVIKVDAEGHDADVIDGMIETLRKARPVLITEHPTDATIMNLRSLGYRFTHDVDSSNGVFLPSGSPR